MNDNHYKVLRKLNDAGYESYFVGGSVRDRLLDRQSKDVDICTAATPEQVKKVFGNVEFVGAHFGVSLVKEYGKPIEVATFRTDGTYGDSRRPNSVTLVTDVMEDLKRRDFTINTLLMNSDNRLFNYCDGLDDLYNGVIRAVGNPAERFEEDALRMLRAIRFASQLGFSIEEKTWEAIKVQSHRIKYISYERVQGELNKILQSGRAHIGVALLSDSGLLADFMPEFNDLKNCPQNPKWHPEGNVYNHTLGLLKQLEPGCCLSLALGALLHDIGKPACLKFNVNVATGERTPAAHGHEERGVPIAEAILVRLKYPTTMIEVVKEHVARHMTFSDLPQMRRNKALKFVRWEHFAELLELHRMDRMAGSGDASHYDYAVKLLLDTPPEVLRPRPLINGKDLIELGLTPGPLFKRIIETIEAMQLDGSITTHEEAVEIVKAWAEEK